MKKYQSAHIITWRLRFKFYVSVAPKEKCMLPKVVGHCRGNFKQYYYDHVKQDCLEFSYGGCGGNANNFNTYNECINSCGKRK